jgi:hypothetical protein
MLDMEAKLGHRLGLDAIAQATLGVQKTAASLDAIRWWRDGRIADIAEYCCFDVKVTRMVHEHGCRHKELFFHDRFADGNGSRLTGRTSTKWPNEIRLGSTCASHAACGASPQNMVARKEDHETAIERPFVRRGAERCARGARAPQAIVARMLLAAARASRSLLTNLYLDRQTMIDFVSPAIEIALERLGATAGVGRSREQNAATGRARRFPIAFPKLPAVTRFFLA